MKEILILTRAFESGGLEVALTELLKRLDKEKYHITLHCVEKIGPLQKEIPEGMDVKEIPFCNEKYRMFVNHRKMPNTSLRVLINKVYKKCCEFFLKVDNEGNRYYEYILKKTERVPERYDAVLDFYGYGHFLSAYGAEYVTSDKKIMWLHDEKLEWLELTAPYLKFYDKFYCVSQTVKNNFEELYPQYKDKAEILYNYVDIDRIKLLAEEKLTDQKYKGNCKILTVGRLSEQKGYDYAIEAAKLLKESGVSFIWYIIGEGIERTNMEHLIRKYGLEQEFILLGRIENPYPYIQTCDLYVQPSRHEGFGIAVLEAKVLCRPIIISNTPCLKEQIEDNVNGYIVQLEPKALAEKIKYVLSQKEARDKVTEELKSIEFNFGKEMDKLEVFLDS